VSRRGAAPCGRSRALGAALALAAACAGLGGSERLRSRLVGLDAKELRSCVGVPESVELTGDLEVLLYRFAEVRSTFPGVIPTGGPPVVRVPPGSVDRRGETAGFCELSFALRGGKVAEVTVRARRSSGLNDDAACLRRTESCPAGTDDSK
jgi:hypothetical protein